MKNIFMFSCAASVSLYKMLYVSKAPAEDQEGLSKALNRKRGKAKYKNSPSPLSQMAMMAEKDQ